MSQSMEEIRALAQTLTNEEKLQLAEQLISQVAPANAEIHESWKEEVARRIEADKQGLLDTHDYDEVMNKYRA